MKVVHGWAFPDADTFMAHAMTATGSYQADHLAEALSHVADFRCAVDGGAHVGLWTVPLAGRFDQVIAIEPAEDTFRALQANLATQRIENVEAHQVALGEKRGLVGLALDPTQAARQNTGGRYVVPEGQIRSVAIDDWHLEALGFLKLDVEGSEYLALRGAVMTLRRCRPVVLFEDKAFGARYGESWLRARGADLARRDLDLPALTIYVEAV